jgi:hypothetical protein
MLGDLDLGPGGVLRSKLLEARELGKDPHAVDARGHDACHTLHVGQLQPEDPQRRLERVQLLPDGRGLAATGEKSDEVPGLGLEREDFRLDRVGARTAAAEGGLDPGVDGGRERVDPGGSHGLSEASKQGGLETVPSVPDSVPTNRGPLRFV